MASPASEDEASAVVDNWEDLSFKSDDEAAPAADSTQPVDECPAPTAESPPSEAAPAKPLAPSNAAKPVVKEEKKGPRAGRRPFWW